MAIAQLMVDVGATLEDATGVLQYVLVFVFAAIPVIEVLVVVPIAIGLGLDPIATGIVAFAGNTLSVYGLVAFHRRLSAWWRARRGETTTESNDRYARARRLWDRYGLPGISFGGPVLTGVHVAAVVALLAGSRSRDVAAWMTVGIAAWTVVIVVGSVLGLSLLGLS
ncbi:small multi-drug export protein [Natrarchaeobius chitinivorans]|uniref:Small multi-drug export protein n=1 Tax=Natrarchaeobius chitinivorans TaxID=1679083 RepID=A0A3N6M252_NATCH|nr:small multi-drug export protein [Natrarchaeobius chitinivorans]RQG94444.1 small multi-drug export protein [Natrarchaeobius chitinivorans]